jgi:hypothetical protein
MLVVTILAGCGGSEKEAGRTATTAEDRLAGLANAGQFVGGVSGTIDLVGINFDRTDKGDKDRPYLRIFVSNGMPGGSAEWFEGRADPGRFALTSASGKARIDGTIQPIEAAGMITLADGVARRYFTRPAGDGAGIFTVSVSPQGMWHGRSLDGATLDARQQGDAVVGSVKTAKGEEFDIHHLDLSRKMGFSVLGGQTDDYTLLVTRRATEIAGRGGGEALRRGQPSANIVTLDFEAPQYPTPGIYFGRVAGTTDRLAFDLASPAPDGTRRLRSYTSDAEPEPAGDIEWFSAAVSGSTFDLLSASGNAHMQGEIADDGIGGTLTLPDGTPRRFFASPTGDGAGIYDVTVTQQGADRKYVGTSDRGGRLELAQQGELVMGAITADGRSFDLVGADLTLAFQYAEPGSRPDTYVAFTAPRGRFVIGRAGDVRAGHPGVNIIGLDKKC